MTSPMTSIPIALARPCPTVSSVPSVPSVPCPVSVPMTIPSFEPLRLPISVAAPLRAPAPPAPAAPAAPAPGPLVRSPVGTAALKNFATVPVSWAPVECSDPRMLRRPEASPHTVHGPWPDAWNLIPRRDAAMRASQPGKSAPEKVLIWRCRHPHGLFSMFSLALGHADTCERQGLGLIVDWSSSELLYRGPPGESNVWSAFFQQPADLQMTCEAVRQAIRSGRYLETTKHHAVYGRYRGVIQDYGGIPLEQAAHGRALCRRNIALQPRFQEKLEKTMASILTPGKRLAVHIRRSDKVVEAAANFELSDEKLLQRIVAQCSAWQMDGVFLCSDDASLKKRLTRALDAAGLHVSTYDATLPSEASQAAHFDKSLDSYKKAEDVVMEAFLMAKGCHGLLSTYSNVSAAVVYLSSDGFPYTTFWDPVEANDQDATDSPCSPEVKKIRAV